MFKTRLLSSIVLLTVTIAVMVLGDWLLWTVLVMVSLVGVWELYRVLGTEKSVLGVAGYAGTLAWWLLPAGFFQTEELSLAAPVLAGAFILVLFVFVFAYPKYRADQLFGTVFGILYLPVMLSFLYLTRETIKLGEWLVWMAFIASWGSDTCAYTVGILIGKHKLAPVLSPKKSIEGAVGGIVGAALLGALFGIAMCHFTGEPNELVPVFALMGGAGSVVSQIGDLAASGIKRCYEVKDYGRLIPGHGGILDRFDSVIVTAPIVYYLALWLIPV